MSATANSRLVLACLIAAALLPVTGMAQTAPKSNVPASVAAKIGMPPEALISYKKEVGDALAALGPQVDLVFIDAMVTPEQVRDAPARICKWLGRGVMSYEFKPRAQKPGAPLTRRLRIQCART